METDSLYELYKNLKIKDFEEKALKNFNKQKSKLFNKIVISKFGKMPKNKILSGFKNSDEYKELFEKEVSYLKEVEDNDLKLLIDELSKDNNKYIKEFNTIKNLLIEFKDTEDLSLKFLYDKAKDRCIEEFYLLDKEALFGKYKDKIIKTLDEDIFTFLSESDYIYVINNTPHGIYSVDLIANNIDDFCDYFRNYFSEYLGYNEFVESAIYSFIEDVPEIKNIKEKMDFFNKNYNNICELIEEAIYDSDVTNEIRDYFYNKLSKDFILDTLSKNEKYSDVILSYREAKKKDLELSNNVLSSIPKKYIDFYPLARKMKRKFFLHIGPTNSGKTYQSIQALEKADRGIYLSPLRLLAYEQFDRLNKDGVYCSLITGEEEIIVPEATHQSSTIEMLDITKEYDVAVIDEAQLIGDSERGGAWTKAILGVLAREVHICAAPEAEKILTSLINSCRDDLEVTYHTRDTELIMEGSNFSFPEDVRDKDAIIVFSKKDVHSVAAELQKNDIKCSIVYSALPYDVRHKEAEKFNLGETQVVVSTDAIGMGLNMPIRRIIFLQNYKFDGKEVRTLYPAEVKQIAGRAGRRGMFDKGYVNTPFEKKKLRKLLEAPNYEIKNAYIGFPESLIGIDAKLSDIIKKWVEVKTAPKFTKILGEREINLAEILEKECNDKEFIYEFVTIPFDEEKEELLILWLLLFRAEKKGKPLSLENCGIESFEEITTSDELHLVEEEYSKLDLLYQYNRKFSHQEELPKIMKKKEEFSSLMMKFLGTQNLSGRHCKYCGKPLSWNYPYGMCDKCFKKGMHYRRKY